jgi:hypothetical protein
MLVPCGGDEASASGCTTVNRHENSVLPWATPNDEAISRKMTERRFSSYLFRLQELRLAADSGSVCSVHSAHRGVHWIQLSKLTVKGHRRHNITYFGVD